MTAIEIPSFHLFHNNCLEIIKALKALFQFELSIRFIKVNLKYPLKSAV